MSVTTQVPIEHVDELKRFALERTNGHAINSADLIREAIAEKLERLRARNKPDELEGFARRGLAAQSAVDGAIAVATTTTSKPSKRPAAKRRARR
jgi:hypothetical protein